MVLTMLKGKIHRATVTQEALDYVGSITIDENLMDAAHINEYERVEVSNVNNGERFATYVIAGEAGSGIVCLNGSAARCAQPGDKIIVMCYAAVDEREVSTMKPYVVFVDENNEPRAVARYERHGKLGAEERGAPCA